MFRAIRALIAAATFWLSPANGQGADVSLTASLTPPGILAPDADAVVALTLHNAGPNAAPLIAVGTSYPATQGFRTFSLYPVATTAPCSMSFDEFFSPVTGMGTVYVTIFSPANVPVGTTVRCDIGLRVATEAPPRTLVLFGTLVSGIADPNPSNNEAAIVVQLQAAMIPALRAPSMLALAAIVLLIGGYVIRRTRRSS